MHLQPLAGSRLNKTPCLQAGLRLILQAARRAAKLDASRVLLKSSSLSFSLRFSLSSGLSFSFNHLQLYLNLELELDLQLEL